MNRREFIPRLCQVAAGGTAVVMTGCSEQSLLRLPKTRMPKIDPKMIAGVSIYAVQVGKHVKRIEFPALRIIGVAIETTGKVILTYLALREAITVMKEEFDISTSDSELLNADGFMKLLRADGETEEYRVCPPKQAGRTIQI